MSTAEPSGTVAETTLTGRAQDAEPEERRSAPNSCMVFHDHGSEEIRFSRENVGKLLAGGSFFWIDVDQPHEDDYKILREVFKFHPLAVEDSEKFGQRAKFDDYDDFVFIVVYGAVPDDRTGSSRCTASTPRSSSSPSTATRRPRSRTCASATRSETLPLDDPAQLLYRIIDGLVDSFSRSSPTSTTASTIRERHVPPRRRRSSSRDLPHEAPARRACGRRSPRNATCSRAWWVASPSYRG